MGGIGFHLGNGEAMGGKGHRREYSQCVLIGLYGDNSYTCRELAHFTDLFDYLVVANVALYVNYTSMSRKKSIWFFF